MNVFRWLARRIRRLVSRDAVARDLDEEIHHHLELEARQLVREGLDPEEARRLARIRFGGVERTKERVRDARGGRWLEDGFQDLRYGLRSLRRDPGFAAIGVLVLALGIGSVVATTSLVHGVLFRPPPFEEPGRLVSVWYRLGSTGGERGRVPAPDVARLREDAAGLRGLAFLRVPSEGVLGGDGSARSVRVATVSPDFFSLLGVQAARGRTLLADQRPSVPGDRSQGPARTPDPTSLVLSHRVWQEVFGGNPGVVGATVRLNGAPRTVVGVLPASFRLHLPPDAGFRAAVDLWAPLPDALSELRRDPGRIVDQDSDNTGVVIGRLSPGATVPAVQARLEATTRNLEAERPERAAADVRVEVTPLVQDAVSHLRPVLLSLLGAVVLVLLIACLDLSTLLLARGARRNPELALRRALGAGRGRLLRQALAESALLSVLGAALGVAVARVAVDLVVAVHPPGLPELTRVPLYVPGLLTAVPLVLLTIFAMGLAPALRKGGDGTAVGLGKLRFSSTGVARSRLRRRLVAAEIALSVVLLVGAGLFLRSIETLRERDPGFRPEGALTFRVSLRGSDRYPGPAQRARFVRAMEEAVARVPGVTAVGVVGVLPLGGRDWTQPYGRPGEAVERWSSREAHFRVATSGYFEAMGIRVRAGRSFLPEEDLEEERRVVVVDRALARTLGGDTNVVGLRIGIPLDGRPVEAEVVGVVETALQENLTEVPLGTIYVPYRQEASREIVAVARADRNDPGVVAGYLRSAVASVDPAVPIYSVQTMEGYVRAAVGALRFAFGVISGFASVAGLLALVGLYGVVSYVVDRRRRELAIRSALGADPAAVVRLVLREAAGVTACGVVVGALGAVVAGRALGAALSDVRPWDPLTLVAVTGLVLAGSAAAALIPALRAARSDVLGGLRTE